MEYSLDPLDLLVSELIEISRKPAGTFTEAGAGELLQVITQETLAIQNNLVKKVFQIARQKKSSVLFNSIRPS